MKMPVEIRNADPPICGCYSPYKAGQKQRKKQGYPKNCQVYNRQRVPPSRTTDEKCCEQKTMPERSVKANQPRRENTQENTWRHRLRLPASHLRDQPYLKYRFLATHFLAESHLFFGRRTETDTILQKYAL